MDAGGVGEGFLCYLMGVFHYLTREQTLTAFRSTTVKTWLYNPKINKYHSTLKAY